MKFIRRTRSSSLHSGASGQARLPLLRSGVSGRVKNDLRIVTVPMKDNPTVTVMILVEAGSNYESKKENGLSHFLEHMMFKGTKKRSNYQICYELDKVGAVYNAFTGNEYTGYYAKAHWKKLPKLLEIISDIYQNSTFPEKEIEKERGVILQEINMYEDLPMRKVSKVLDDLLYGDVPAGRSILGSKENIKKFNQKDFQEYFQSHYVSGATTVVVAGQIENEKEVVKEIEKVFGGIKKGPPAKKEKTLSKQKTPAVKVENKKTDQSHLMLALRTFDVYDKRNVALYVLNAVLSSGFSSRLFKKMRDELGLCYYISAHISGYGDHGDYAVWAGVGNDQVEFAIQTILEELKKIKDEEVSEEELKKAKESLIGDLAIHAETSDEVANFFGFQVLHREKVKTLKEKIKEIKAVTPKQIQKLAKEIIQNKNLNLAIIGPFKSGQIFKKILKI